MMIFHVLTYAGADTSAFMNNISNTWNNELTGINQQTLEQTWLIVEQ